MMARSIPRSSPPSPGVGLVAQSEDRPVDALDQLGGSLVGLGAEGVEEVHDLHVWTITSGFPALAAHVLVGQEEDCHERRRELEKVLYREFGIEHATLQVDHADDHSAEGPRLQFLPRIERQDDAR